MQEYSKIVIDSLPLMLNPDSKGKAAVTISSYMNEMLRKAKTEQDLEIFNTTLMQCNEFAVQNNLGGLNRTCAKWNHDEIVKLDQMRGNTQQQDMQNNNVNYAKELYERLMQTSSEINKTGMIDPDDFSIIFKDLEEIEIKLRRVGNQYLSDEQIQSFMQEIIHQKEELKVKCDLIDDLLEDNHMTR